MTDAQRKLCSNCRKWLPIEDFWRDSSRLDGRSYKCRMCKGTLSKWRVNGTSITARAKRHGVRPRTALARIKSGWSVSQALNEPVAVRRKADR